MKKMNITLLVTSLFALLPIACKQASQDKGKNKVSGVENLAQSEGYKPVNPICGGTTESSSENLNAWMTGELNGKALFTVGSEDGDRIQMDDPRMVAFAKTASSLREQVIKFLLLTRTKVVFTTGEPAACKTTPDDALFSKFQKEPAPRYSCYQKVVGKPSPVIYFGEIPTEAMVKTSEFYSANDPDYVGDVFIVRRDLVRNVGGIYARMNRLLAAETKVRLNAPDAKLSEQQKQALKAVEAEYDAAIKKRAPLMDAFMCDMHLVEGDQCKAGAAFSDAAKDKVKDIKKSVGDELFGDYLVTEVFDSYFCNEQTKKSFHDNFSSTFSAFESLFVRTELAATGK